MAVKRPWLQQPSSSHQKHYQNGPKRFLLLIKNSMFINVSLSCQAAIVQAVDASRIPLRTLLVSTANSQCLHGEVPFQSPCHPDHKDFHHPSCHVASRSAHSPRDSGAKVRIVDKGIPVLLQGFRQVIAAFLPLTGWKCTGPAPDGREVPQLQVTLSCMALD